MSARAGLHAVITGGGRGIGAAIAMQLAGRGPLTLMGRTKADLELVAASLAGPVSAVVADVSRPDDVAAAFAQARELHGPIAILINNAGVAASAPLAKTTDRMWADVLGINLTGAFYCTRAAAPDMLAAGFGRIVNVASIAGLEGYAYVSAYVASKHGLVGLTRALAEEFAGSGVTVNAVCPGFVETDMVKRAVENIIGATGRTEAAARAELLKRNPIDRFLSPEEVATAVVTLLASERSGEALVLDNGDRGG